MKKRKTLIGIILSILFISAFAVATVYINRLPIDNTKYERVASVIPQDQKITDADKIRGKNVVLGGPYKVGDLVIVENLAVKVDKVGWNSNLFEETDENIGHAIFKVTLYNYTYQPYEVKAEDIMLKYEGKDGKLFKQSLSSSGYDNWKFIKNSFKLGKIESENYREGYIFFPTKEEVRKNGFVRIYLNDVPIDFKY